MEGCQAGRRWRSAPAEEGAADTEVEVDLLMAPVMGSSLQWVAPVETGLLLSTVLGTQKTTPGAMMEQKSTPGSMMERRRARNSGCQMVPVRPMEPSEPTGPPELMKLTACDAAGVVGQEIGVTERRVMMAVQKKHGHLMR